MHKGFYLSFDPNALPLCSVRMKPAQNRRFDGLSTARGQQQRDDSRRCY